MTHDVGIRRSSGETRIRIPNPLGVPPVLPVRQQQFIIFRSAYHTLLIIEAVYDHACVHAHEQATAMIFIKREDQLSYTGGFELREGPFQGPAH
jgi:hypothetical protein